MDSLIYKHEDKVRPALAASAFCGPAAVLINPHSSRGGSRRTIDALRRLFASRRISAEFLTVPELDELASFVRALLSRNVSAVFALGGDGTAQALVNALAGARIPIGILPSGGGNDFAAALGLPPHPIAAAKLLLEGHVVSVDLARARTTDGHERLFIAGGGIGLDVEAVRLANSIYRQWPGKFRYLASAVRAWKKFDPVTVCVEALDASFLPRQKRVLSCAILNTPAYGAGIALAPCASLQDGYLDLAFVEKITASQLVRILPGLIARGNLPGSFVERMRVRQIRVSTDRPSQFQADGELLGPTPVDIAVVPGAFRVLAPLSFPGVHG